MINYYQSCLALTMVELIHLQAEHAMTEEKQKRLFLMLCVFVILEFKGPKI